MVWRRRACIAFSFSGIIHQGGDRSVAGCGPVQRGYRDGGMGGLLVYITQNADRSTCFPIVTKSYWCPGLSSNDVTIRLAAMSSKLLLIMFICSLIFCSIVGSPYPIMYSSVETMVAMCGL